MSHEINITNFSPQEDIVLSIRYPIVILDVNFDDIISSIPDVSGKQIETFQENTLKSDSSHWIKIPISPKQNT